MTMEDFGINPEVAGEEAALDIPAMARARGINPEQAFTPGGGRGRDGKKTGYAPPRGREDPRCVNCCKKGHTASACGAQTKDKHERPCLNCGEPGHLKAGCPN